MVRAILSELEEEAKDFFRIHIDFESEGNKT